MRFPFARGPTVTWPTNCTVPQRRQRQQLGSNISVADDPVGLTLAQQLAIGVALGALVPRALFGYARSLWLVMNYLVAMAEQRHERECPRR